MMTLVWLYENVTKYIGNEMTVASSYVIFIVKLFGYKNIFFEGNHFVAHFDNISGN